MSPLQATDRATATARCPATAAPNASGLIARRGRAVTAASLSVALLVLALIAWATGLWPSFGEGNRSASSVSSATARIPAAARAEVSAALGAAQPAFHVHAKDQGVLAANNAAQGISARFAPGGVTVSKAALNLHLSLHSVGFGDGTHGMAATAANPTAYSNRATYARGSLSEWYANGPAGLEQGFTLLHAPAPAQAGSTAGPLTLDLALAANARPRLAANGQSLTLERGGAQLRYGNLLTTDASGRALRTWLELQGGRLLIRVDAAGARYPLTIDPLVQVGDKLTGADELGEGLLGTSVALSADGSTLLVGGPHDENANHGAAFVFVKEGSSWVAQSPKLTGAESPSGSSEEQCAEESSEEAGECAFGNSVALSADGNTALIGEPSATAMPGSAWVFTRSGTTWTRSAALTGEGGSGEGRFGKSVALSADGQTALIGDPSASSQQGKAWVFTEGVSGWTRAPALVDAESTHLAHFGRSVALSSDGQTALIGAPGDSSYAGSARVFTNGGAGWAALGGKLTGTGESGEARFGKSVALSGGGGTALIGGLNDAEGAGAVWPFARSGSGFAQQGKKLTGEGQPHFGSSVALSGDGTFGLVGSPRAETNGLVTVLTRTDSSWSSAGEKLAGSGGEGKGWSGAAVAVSQDGTVVAVGAPHDSVRRGAAWIFTGSPEFPQPAPAVTSVMPGAGEAGTTVKIKGENFTGADTVFFGSKPATFTVISALTIEAVAPEGLAGTVNVRVRTPSGMSPVSRPADEFRYTTGKAKGGGTENPDPGSGGLGTGEGTPGSQTTTGGGGAKIASGGVLGATTSSSGAACVLSLRNKHLAVTGSRTVALRLQRTGAGACNGKLTLSFNKAKRGKRPKLQMIGTASFAMGSASSKVLKIDLNKAGRKLFSSHGRRLNASLSFVRSLPAPNLARSASVRLTWKKTKKVTLGR